VAVFYDWEGNRRSSVVPAVCHRPSGISTYRTICLSVCLSVCLPDSPSSKRKTSWAVSTKVDWDMPVLHGRTSACIDPEVRKSKVKVAGSRAELAWVCRWIRLHISQFALVAWLGFFAPGGGRRGEVRPPPRKSSRRSHAETPIIRFLARDVIYTSRAYATISVSVCLTSLCDGSALAHYS